MESIYFASNQPGMALMECLVLAVSYVASLYINKSQYPRDHPHTIKQRIKSVAFVSILGPVFVYIRSMRDDKEKINILRWLGLHPHNFMEALLYPLLLTIMLFLGPTALWLEQDGIFGIKDNLFRVSHLVDLKWYRTYIVAPFTEEFIFRACMLPILLPNFGIKWSIFLAPLFFGVAHFHHVIEQLHQHGSYMGHQLVPVLLTSLFQMAYTTLFGAYSAFLFLRTGHLIGPVLCHSFCNMMGFPNFESVPGSAYPKLVSVAFVLGLFVFMLLLFPLTEPTFFDSIYWA